jgi:cytochrome P450
MTATIRPKPDGSRSDKPKPDRLIPPRPDPSPPGLSWYQILAAYRKNALSTWSEQAFEKDVIASTFLGRDRVLINNPDGIRRVLVDNHTNYRRSPATIRILRPIIGQGLFLSEGDDWRHQRHTLAPAFTPRAIPLLARHIVDATQDALIRIGVQAEAGPVDLISACQYLALDVAGRSMFSLEMLRHGAAMRRLLARYSERLGRPYLLDLLLPASIPNLHDLARFRFKVEWMRLIEAIMNDRRQAPAARDDAPRDLFDLLEGARNPETGAGFPPDQLRDQVATMIVAGHETTAVTIFWSLTLLALAPEVQERVALEVASLAPGLDLSREGAAQALPHLVLTRAVVQEALRLYPPAFVLVREAIHEDTVCGARLRPRGLAIIAPWVLHRHRKLWQDPDAFDPSRFLPGAPPPDRFAYLPFGAGPRVCIGAQFAMTEAVLVVASLVSAFQIEPAGQRPIQPAAVITTQPDHAAPFRLSRRGEAQ